MTTKINSNNISNTGVNAGSYVNSALTINQQGQVTAASSGNLIPLINSINITDSDWTPLDDLEASTTVAYLRINGKYFEQNCVILLNNLAITAVNRLSFTKTTTSFQSLSPVLDFNTTTNLTVGMIVSGHNSIAPGTTILAILSSTRIQLSKALTATMYSETSVTFSDNDRLTVTASNIATGLYNLSVVNPTGGIATRVNAITFGPLPAWQTNAKLPQAYQETSYSQQLSATSAITYILVTGSTLPGTLTLSSSGLISGTLPQVTQNTDYIFSVQATDAQLQDSIRTFTLTVLRGPATATISPAVSGKTTWDFNTDGPLNLTTAGTWILTPTVAFFATAKVWGAAGGGGSSVVYGTTSTSGGGGGGYSSGRISFANGTAYRLVVGSGGNYSSTTSGGTGGTGAGTGGTGGTGTSGNTGGGGGGGGSGIFVTSISQANAILIAGGGGGAASIGYTGGAGGGTTGDPGVGHQDGLGPFYGQGGTQSAAGSAGTSYNSVSGRLGSAGSGMNGGGGGAGVVGGTGVYFSSGGGAGGAGYFGGGGGTGGEGDSGAGGGGSGRVSPNTSLVTQTITQDGQNSVPGNSTDSNRLSTAGVGNLAANGSPGQIYLFA